MTGNAANETGVIGHSRRAIVLVHGSWHGAWCYAPIVPLLAVKGITAVAFDLPGYGLSAKLPESYRARAFNAATFSSERSPVAGVTLKESAARITEVIDALVIGGFGPITLFAHSMGGVPATVAAELRASKIKKLIYLSAFMPVTEKAAGYYVSVPEMADSKVLPLVCGDPSAIGALRLDPSSEDESYRIAMKEAFYATASDAAAIAASHLLTCDAPMGLYQAPTGATVANWGSIPRSYISCTEDVCVPPAVHSLFVQEADALTPANRTDFRTIPGDHSPFLSRPQALTDLIASLAA
jgi:pimeloyl-ACP methyl ester carboxylesterase